MVAIRFEQLLVATAMLLQCLLLSQACVLVNNLCSTNGYVYRTFRFYRIYRSIGVRTNFRRGISTVIFSLIASSRESIEFQNNCKIIVISISKVEDQVRLYRCDRSLSQQFSAFVFPGLRRPIPREFPPDLIARARGSTRLSKTYISFLISHVWRPR